MSDFVVYEPSRLILTWQPILNEGDRGSRHAVAEVIRSNNQIVFKYLKNSKDFNDALALGFEGYPAFSLDKDVHDENVMGALMRRLPPRSRPDFFNYLNRHLLPEDFKGSDFSLLAYTGAGLASDSFSICPDLRSAEAPFDIPMQIAGYRYNRPKNPKILNKCTLSFVREDNPHDPDAIAICANGSRIGYVSRVMCNGFDELLNNHSVEAKVTRLNGTPERPTAWILLKVR